MNTLHLRECETDKAAEILRHGGIVAIPTETVYGLAADAFNETAIKKIFIAKGRPSDNPLIVHIADIKSINDVVLDFTDTARKLAKIFWPGPLTIILPKNPKIPYIASGGLDTVAVRCPSHIVARDVIKKAGVPLVAPSANLSGKPSPTKFSHVVGDMDGKIDAIVDGGDCDIGVESTVLSLLGKAPKILRPGAVGLNDLKKVIGDVEIDKAVYSKVEAGQKIFCPGVKYKHYSPDTPITMVICDSAKKYADFLNNLGTKNVAALCFDEDIQFLNIPYISYGSMMNSFEQSSKLFSSLREVDGLNVERVYVHYFYKDEMSMAIYNRLIRSAAFDVLEI